LPGLISAEVDPSKEAPRRVAITFRKPKGNETTKSDETTVRQCDAEFLYAAILHVIHGGRFFIHVNESKEQFYWRINVYGRDGTTKHETYALRLIVGTEPGFSTNEAQSFHDLTRAALGRFHKSGDGGAGGKYGRQDMIAWSVAQYRKQPGRAAFPTADAYRDLMEEAYTWLEDVPLRFAPPTP
jgi:hypothetical protein